MYNVHIEENDKVKEKQKQNSTTYKSHRTCNPKSDSSTNDSSIQTSSRQEKKKITCDNNWQNEIESFFFLFSTIPDQTLSSYNNNATIITS